MSFSLGNVKEIKKRYLEIRNNVLEQLNDCGYYVTVKNILNAEDMDYIDAIYYSSIRDTYLAYILNDNSANETDEIYGGTGKNLINLHNKTIMISQIRGELSMLDRLAKKRFELNVRTHNDGFNQYQDDNAVALESVRAAEIEAKKIVEEANREAEQIKNDAKYEADSIISDAKIKEKNIVESGKIQSNLFIEEGKAEKQRIIDNISQEEYNSGLKKRVKEHFETAQLEEREVRKKLDSAYNSIVEGKNVMLDSINQGVQELHSSLMREFGNAISSIQNIQSNIHDQLGLWQKNLYKNDLKDIAMCFMTLGRMISSMEEKITTHLARSEQERNEELVDELSQIVKNLKILKNNFESSLAKNSIKLLIPDIGESFNSNYHTAENIDYTTEDDDSLNGKRIIAVHNAGLIKVFNSADDVLFRAVVTVEK